MHTGDQLPTNSLFVTHRTRGEGKDILSVVEELKSYPGKDWASVFLTETLGKRSQFLMTEAKFKSIPFSGESNLGNKLYREMSFNSRGEKIDHCHLKRSYSAPSAHSTNGQKYNPYGAM